MLSRKPSTGCLQIPAQIAQIRIAEDNTLKPEPTDHIGRGSCMHLPRVLLTVRHNTVHQLGRAVLVMPVRAALTEG